MKKDIYPQGGSINCVKCSGGKKSLSRKIMNVLSYNIVKSNLTNSISGYLELSISVARVIDREIYSRQVKSSFVLSAACLLRQDEETSPARARIMHAGPTPADILAGPDMQPDLHATCGSQITQNGPWRGLWRSRSCHGMSLDFSAGVLISCKV